jgi:AMP-binding enzyme
VRQSDENPELPRRAAANSLAAIVYTSGTTGRSKGATLTRANLETNAAVLVEAWRFASRDILLHALPELNREITAGVRLLIRSTARARIADRLSHRSIEIR